MKYSNKNIDIFQRIAYTMSKKMYEGDDTMFGLESLVPVTMFNKGQATKIFDRVKTEGQIIVLKNNAPEAVIVSTDEYTRLTEIEENYYLLMEANERLSKANTTLTEENVMERLGISQSDIDAADDVEIG